MGTVVGDVTDANQSLIEMLLDVNLIDLTVPNIKCTLHFPIDRRALNHTVTYLHPPTE
jgi:hypothetical protein